MSQQLKNQLSIQILRASELYDPSVSEVALLYGQPFYSKKNKQLYIGEGDDKQLKDTQPITSWLLAGTGLNSTLSYVSTTPKLDVVEGDDPTADDFDISKVVVGKMNPRGGATGKYATVVGLGNTGAGRNNLISGTRNYSNGNENTTFGQGNYNTGVYSLVGGGNNLVGGGSYMFVYGSNNELPGTTSIPMTQIESTWSGAFCTLDGGKSFAKPDYVTYKISIQLSLDNGSRSETIGPFNLKNNIDILGAILDSRYDLAPMVNYQPADEYTPYDTIQIYICGMDAPLLDMCDVTDVVMHYSSNRNDKSNSVVVVGNANEVENIQTSFIGGKNNKVSDTRVSLVYGYANNVKGDDVANATNIILGDYFNANVNDGSPLHTDSIGHYNVSVGSANRINKDVSNAILLGSQLTATQNNQMIVGINSDASEDISNYSIVLANGDKGGTPSNILLFPKVGSSLPTKLKSDLDISTNKLIVNNIELLGQIDKVSSPLIGNGVFKADNSLKKMSVFDLLEAPNMTISSKATVTGQFISSKYHGATDSHGAYSNKLYAVDGQLTICTDKSNPEANNTGVAVVDRNGIKVGTFTSTPVNTTTGLPHNNNKYTTIITKDSVTSPKFIGTATESENVSKSIKNVDIDDIFEPSGIIVDFEGGYDYNYLSELMLPSYKLMPKPEVVTGAINYNGKEYKFSTANSEWNNIKLSDDGLYVSLQYREGHDMVPDLNIEGDTYNAIVVSLYDNGNLLDYHSGQFNVAYMSAKLYASDSSVLGSKYAINDADGNNIVKTYATKGDLNEVKTKIKGHDIDTLFDLSGQVIDRDWNFDYVVIGVERYIYNHSVTVFDCPSIISGIIRYNNSDYEFKHFMDGKTLDVIKIADDLYINVSYFRSFLVGYSDNVSAIRIVAFPSEEGANNMSYPLESSDVVVKSFTTLRGVLGASRSIADKYGNDIVETYATKEDLSNVESGGGLTEEELVNLGFVKNTDYATKSKIGLMRPLTGLQVNSTGAVSILPAYNEEQIKSRGSDRVFTFNNLDKALKIGLTTNTEVLTKEDQESIQKWFGMDARWYENLYPSIFLPEHSQLQPALVSQSTLSDPTQITLNSVVWDLFDIIYDNGEWADCSLYSLKTSAEIPLIVSAEDYIFNQSVPEEYWIYAKRFVVSGFATLKEIATNTTISETIPFTIAFAYGDLLKDGTTQLGICDTNLSWYNGEFTVNANLAFGMPTCKVSLLIKE